MQTSEAACLRKLIVSFLAVALWQLTGATPLFPAPPSEQNNLAIFITGLTGNSEFRTEIARSRDAIVRILRSNGYREDQVVQFSEAAPDQAKGVRQFVSNKESLESALNSLGESGQVYDRLFIFVAGHANGRDEEAMFHLPGKDVAYRDLIKWIDQIQAAHTVVIVAAPQGQAWIKALSRANRVLVAGNGLREFDFIPTMFLYFFPLAISNPAYLDKTIDKSAPVSAVSLRDVFMETQKQVQAWYRESGLHATELALIDANGDGKGESLLLPDQKPAGQQAPSQPQFDYDLPDAQIAHSLIFSVPGGDQSGRSSTH